MPDTNTQTAQAQRPRLRGALHVWAAVAALIAGPVLCVVAAERGGQRALVGSVVYAVTLFGLFAISATFHRVTWRPRAYMTMKRLDHSMIYVFIAGCYTAFCQILLEPQQSLALLTAVWTGAILGVALKIVWPRPPRWLGFVPYLVLGSMALGVLPEFFEHGGPGMVALLLTGGAIYAVGGACWAIRWPNPWPDTFGHHEIFHAAVIIAAIAHHAAIYAALYA